MNPRPSIALIGASLVILATAGCGSSVVSPPGRGPAGTTRSAGSPTAPAPAPGPPERPCAQPTSLEDLRLGTKVILEASVPKGMATSDNAGGSVIPMQDVKVLWSNAPAPPTPSTLIASNVAVYDAELFLHPGRYVLLLGSSTPGVYYLAEGREGAFAYVDESGILLTRLCTVYSSDGRAQPAVRAPDSIARETLLGLSIAAAESDPANS